MAGFRDHSSFRSIETGNSAHISIMTFAYLNPTSKTPEAPSNQDKKIEENQVEKMFFPMRLILQILGRFPFSTTSTSRRVENLERKTYNDSLLSFHWLYFAITSAISLFIFFVISLGFANVYMGWELEIFPNSTFNKCEVAMFESNLVPFVLFWSCLLHAIVGNVSFFKNRKVIVRYLNQWEETIATLQIKLSMTIRTYLIVANCWFIGFLLVTVILHHLEIMRAVRRGSEVIALLCLKPFVSGDVVSSQNENRQFFSQMAGIANFALVYSMYASRALLFLYAYKCRLLRYAFKKWNKRMEELLDDKNREKESGNVDTYGTLYRDHIILVSTVKQTDRVFGGILQAYYASQIMNMCFEMYYLARSGTFKSSAEDCNFKANTDHGDIIAALLLLGQNISIFLQVSLDAARVQDEAQKGYEILRSKAGHLCFESRPKRYFVKTLMQSFSQRIVMTGGKFFSIDRPFVITVCLNGFKPGIKLVFPYRITYGQFSQEPPMEFSLSLFPSNLYPLSVNGTSRYLKQPRKAYPTECTIWH